MRREPEKRSRRRSLAVVPPGIGRGRRTRFRRDGGMSSGDSGGRGDARHAP